MFQVSASRDWYLWPTPGEVSLAYQALEASRPDPGNRQGMLKPSNVSGLCTRHGQEMLKPSNVSGRLAVGAWSIGGRNSPVKINQIYRSQYLSM